VSHIKAQRPDRSVVAKTQPYGVRGVVEICGRVLAELQQAHPSDGRINVADIMKKHQPVLVFLERDAKLERIQEQSLAADREPGNGITRPRPVEGEPAVGLAAAHKETLRQRDLMGTDHLALAGGTGNGQHRRRKKLDSERKTCEERLASARE